MQPKLHTFELCSIKQSLKLFVYPGCSIIVESVNTMNTLLQLTTLSVILFLVTHCESPSTVIIIGAGASGIATATKLLENDINFVVLEAEERVGGRIYSVKFGEANVDLGAQWSHGEQNNVIYELVKDLNLLHLSDFRKRIHYSSRTFNVSLKEQLTRLYRDILREIPSNDQSFGDFVAAKYYDRVAETFGKNRVALKYAREILGSFQHDVLMQRGAFSWYNLSATSNYDHLKGNSYLNWKGLGHTVVLDVMMKTYPDPTKELPIRNKILFGKEVSQVIWDGNVVQVRCSDKSEYFAHHVVVTVPLGVLKATYNTMFTPTLPLDKIDAIHNLGMEAVVKVVAYFLDKWWNDADFQMGTLCWDSDDLEKLTKEFPEGPTKEEKSWLENLYMFHTTEKNPRVLIAWFTGEFVPEIELLPDETIVNGIYFVLNKFFGNRYAITKPDGILRHNWYSNPHFRGVYSFETVKSRQADEFGANVLQKPLMTETGKLAVLFAGEASSPNHYATVHGAIESGHREARRIIDLYK